METKQSQDNDTDWSDEELYESQLFQAEYEDTNTSKQSVEFTDNSSMAEDTNTNKEVVVPTEQSSTDEGANRIQQSVDVTEIASIIEDVTQGSEDTATVICEKEFVAELFTNNTCADTFNAHENVEDISLITNYQEDNLTEPSKIPTTESVGEAMNFSTTLLRQSNDYTSTATKIEAGNQDTNCNKEVQEKDCKEEKHLECRVTLTRIDRSTEAKRSRKVQVKRQLIKENSDLSEMSDDSCKDATYSPSKKDLNSTDSETEVLRREQKNMKVQKKTRKKEKSKQPPKKPLKDKNNENVNKNQRKSQNKVSALQKRSKELKNKLSTKIKHFEIQRKGKPLGIKKNDLQKAKEVSLKLHSIKAVIQKFHKDRLDQLLGCNELERAPVSADGNCFFAAVVKSAKLDKTATKLRSELCDYMVDNVERYIPFCSSIQSNETDRTEQFLQELKQLQESGEWNLNLADCFPLAVADMFSSTVRVYSSVIATPVYEIKPRIMTNPPSCICLAYLAIRGEEHYEAVTKLNHEWKGDTKNLSTPLRSKSKPQTSGLADPTLSDNIMIEHVESTASTPVTPHKRANYKSPAKKLSSRKKKRDTSKWKCNIRKERRCKGQEYVSKSGKSVPGKSVQYQDCSKCRFKCNEKIPERARQDIFNFYYSLGSYERKRDYICEMVNTVKPVRSKGFKTESHQYFFVSGNQKIRVCRNFLMRTLDIGRKTIDYSLKRKTHGAFGGRDKRGKHSPSNKLKEDQLSFIHRHIKSFPKMESHYIRKKSTKEYLAHDLNIRQMWILYCDECKKNNLKAVKQSKYRQIFCENYNLSFFKPKKDQCSLCEEHNRKHEAGVLDDATKKRYDLHQIRKQEARDQKSLDKSSAITDKSRYVATFDLQAVLTTPCSLVNEMYYARKLCCYNLTIYSLGDKQVYCHLWDETQGKRGSCEIATCLMKNTMSICSASKELKQITYFSDTCGGQNRNKYVAASFLYVLHKLPNVEIIEQKFLQSGHSQMECDSVHSTIETAKRKTEIYVPSQWSTLITLARKGHPYITVPLKYDHILNWKEFVDKFCQNLKVAVTGERVNWLNIRWIQVRKSTEKSLFVNYGFNDNEFLEIKVQSLVTRKKGKQQEWPEQLSLCYQTKLPVSCLKKNDLVSLCNKGVIPEEFQGYYKGLPTSNKVTDRIPSPGSDEESDDTDSD